MNKYSAKDPVDKLLSELLQSASDEISRLGRSLTPAELDKLAADFLGKPSNDSDREFYAEMFSAVSHQNANVPVLMSNSFRFVLASREKAKSQDGKDKVYAYLVLCPFFKEPYAVYVGYNGHSELFTKRFSDLFEAIKDYTARL